ncbi:hypothetical protein VSS85_15245, partial [Klebsiella pneumoniae]|nr:hypothetical protein [Klebsiella pneumoniae]
MVTHRRCRCLLCGILPMPEHVHHIVKRLILYICICLLAGIGISGMTAFFHTSFSSTSSILFPGNDSNLLIVFYVQIVPDDFVMQLHR